MLYSLLSWWRNVEYLLEGETLVVVGLRLPLDQVSIWENFYLNFEFHWYLPFPGFANFYEICEMFTPTKNSQFSSIFKKLPMKMMRPTLPWRAHRQTRGSKSLLLTQARDGTSEKHYSHVPGISSSWAFVRPLKREIEHATNHGTKSRVVPITALPGDSH